MSVDLGRLVAYLNDTLMCQQFEESAINGLQVAGKKKVKKIAFAVDGVLETFEMAVAAGADLLIVHHGLYWGFQWPLRGADYKRVKLLMDNDLALYAAHLPLDAHAELGHAANLLRELGVENRVPFGRYKGMSIGFMGEIPECSRTELHERLETLLGDSVKLLPFGPEKVRRVACVTGQGADFSLVREAKIQNIHFYISGEASHPIYHYCRENLVSLALGGHYRTEVFGLRALKSHLENQYDVETVWLEAPTGF